ncbi:hypothetical protein [Streptomyces sp. HPF1205]|uniref:hypothetical protein n=1 Tax=Streptomyces sp. HPF1205 TaxID=2873262 RepID=UPI001CED56A3|nr:hypothetical protein [Streptomyces sp. HPF1205]
MASPATSVRAGAGLRLLRAAVFTAVCVVLAAAGHSLAAGRPVPGTSLALAWLAVFAVVAPLAGRERSLPGIATLLALGQVVLHAVFTIGRTCAYAAGAGAAAGTTPGSAGTSAGGGLAALAARLTCGLHGQRLTPAAARAIVSRAGLDPSAYAAGTGGGHLAWGSWPTAMPGMPGMPSPSADADGGTAGVGGGAFRGAHSLLTALPFCSLPMLLGHLLAAVVAGWLLRRGEAALWRLIRLSLRVRGARPLSPAAALRRAHALLSALASRSPYPWPRGRAGTDAAAPGRHRTVWLRHSVARRGPPAFALAA